MQVTFIDPSALMATVDSRRRLDVPFLMAEIGKGNELESRIPRQFNVNAATKGIVDNWTLMKRSVTALFLVLSLFTIPYARDHFWIMISAL